MSIANANTLSVGADFEIDKVALSGKVSRYNTVTELDLTWDTYDLYAGYQFDTGVEVGVRGMYSVVKDSGLKMKKSQPGQN